MMERKSQMSRKTTLDMKLKNRDTDAAVKILAKSLYRKLISNGFTNNDVVNLSKEILDHLSKDVGMKPLQGISPKKTHRSIG